MFTLRGAIGNRAFGSLLRRPRLTRQAAGKLKGAGRSVATAGDDELRAFIPWPELAAALADPKQDVDAVIDRVSQDQLRFASRLESWLKELLPKMSPERFARLAAAILLDSRYAPLGRKEALRVLSAMLQDKEAALRMILTPVKVVIVPRDRQPTELEEFRSFLTGETIDGRQWAHVRGFANVSFGEAVYAAIPEENLLGGPPDPKVWDAPKDAGGKEVGTKSSPDIDPVGYSVTTHEVAHLLHRHGLSDQQRADVTKCYDAKRRATTGKEGLVKNVWPDGPRVSPVAPQDWKELGWTDEKRLDYLVSLPDDARREYENFSSQNEHEYFAQLVNAYLGTNVGFDAATGAPLNNGRAWVAANEPELLVVLDRLFKMTTVNDIEPGGALKPGGRHTNPAKAAPGRATRPSMRPGGRGRR